MPVVAHGGSNTELPSTVGYAVRSPSEPQGDYLVTRGCGYDGGLAEFLLVPRSEVISIGDGDPVMYAPLTDAAVTAYHTIRTAVQRLKPGTSAALIGIGGLGSYGVQFIKLLTSARIFAIDNIEGRLQHSKELGADEAALFAGDGAVASAEVLSRTRGRGVDVIVDSVGTTDTLKLTAKISRPQGRIVLVGLEEGTLQVGWGLLATSCEFAISMGSARQDLREVCELARSGKLGIDVQRFEFNDVQKAYDALRAGALTGRAFVVFP